MYSFPDMEPVCCSMSSSNWCFLTCIQISQEAGQVVWYSHLFNSFLQFVVIHTVQGFGVVDKAEVDVFLELSSSLMIQWMWAIWSLVPLPFLNPAWTSGISQLLKPGLENFEHYFASKWDECNCAVVCVSISLHYSECRQKPTWIIIGRTDAEAPILWPPDVKSWLIGKNTNAGKHWKQKE